MYNTQLRLKESTEKKIKYICKQQNRSINAQINFILEQFIKDYEKINGEIKNEQ